MQKINGKYTSAVIYSETAEEYAKAQVKMICDSEAALGSEICMMPDVHPGKVGPVGLTMNVKDKVMPSLIGTDIGCGVSYIKIKTKKIEFQQLDKTIKRIIPSGFDSRKVAHTLSDEFPLEKLYCKKYIHEDKARKSLGTLGSGNHFIEVDKDEEGYLYVFVHSGSRYLGKAVAEYYLKEGQKELKRNGVEIPFEMTYLEEKLMEEYIYDQEIVTEYARLNRQIILNDIAKTMKWKILDTGETIHNYIDNSLILRKGAVSAIKGKEVAIPINMKDGILLCEGLGNPKWNYSAPHGAGRVFSRSDVKNHHTVSEYKKEMKGVYTSIIGKDTLEESPFAYRRLDEIKEAIGDTVKITKILKPVYSYKAGGKE